MSRKIQILRSKINLLNSQIAQFHDSGLFSPEEISQLCAPIAPQVQELHEEILKLKANENDTDGDAAMNSQSLTTYELR